MVECAALKTGSDGATIASSSSTDGKCLVDMANPESKLKKPAAKEAEQTPAERFAITSGFFSQHFGPRPNDPSYKLNGDNWGLGANYQINDRFGVSAGYYYSSTRTNNTYATVDYNYLNKGNFSFGVSGGLVTGYQDLHGRPQPLLVPTATQHIGKDFFIRELVIPPLHNVTPAVLSVQFGVYPARLFHHKN